MPEISSEEVQKILSKYQGKINIQLGEKVPEKYNPDAKPVTKEYLEFKDEYLPKHFTFYEQAANYAEKYLHLKPSAEKEKQYQESIDICHLNITPSGAYSVAFLGAAAVALLGVIFSFALFNGSMFMIVFFVGSAAGMILPFMNIPLTFANSWRMAASNQMVLSVFYVVTYMRHTSNLELAVEFASKHLSPPLALDLRKVICDVETQKYENIKESLDAYLETWKKWNLEYVEAMHLIMGSLYESAEERRLQMLDKSLTVILEETYEKMLHYAQNLKSPITMLHMLGIILPILGLVILPLMVSFMEGVEWYHISALYNLGLPFLVYYMGTNILAMRPTGYGDTDISEDPALADEKKMNLDFLGIKMNVEPLILCIAIAVVSILIGFSPILLHALGVADFGFGGEDALSTCGQKFCFMGYKPSSKLTDGEGNPIIQGPFGLGAAILSLGIIFGIGFSIGLYYKLQSKNVMEIRNRSKELEQEFASALFQLGNRLGDGIPAEIAFVKVASTMQGSISGQFFEAVTNNITRQGMSVEQAIFDPHHGALLAFPSSLIESSMKVLTESAKKGPLVAAQALMNISQYIKQMHTVNERLQDLMAETISSMKSQIKFLTPVISGIVIGITSMITTILGKLSTQMKNIQQGSATGAGMPGGLTDMFGDGIPTFYFQLIVGLYVIQLAYILTILTNGIENGTDKLGEKYNLGQNVTKGTTIYCFLATVVMIGFNLVAGSILGSGK